MGKLVSGEGAKAEPAVATVLVGDEKPAAEISGSCNMQLTLKDANQLVLSGVLAEENLVVINVPMLKFLHENVVAGGAS